MSKQSKALMILGTGSGAGKSLIAAAMCRIFRDMGINVAPFKAQNMALNSYVTADGGEIGRAQALQAEAAGIEATVDMNPVLLKASGEMGSQVIIHGKVHSNMKAREYYAFKKEAWKAVETSYERLSGRHELIIMEGAGSPAEINLMDVDIVNIAAAKHAKAPAILVGDIDKGGVFASLYGTVKLLGKDSRHVKAFLINKFRGDIEILRPGLDMIRQKTLKPVIGVLPYISNIGLPEEDGLSLQKQPAAGYQHTAYNEKIKIIVVRSKYISNFTDFDPLLHEPDVEFAYSQAPSEIENADIVIIPGSKNTVKDLLYLKERRLDESLRKAYVKGVQIIGMCGGYQMLGRKIFDPLRIESSHKEIDGIGLLNIETTFGKEKTTCRVEAEIGNDPFNCQPSPTVGELKAPTLAEAAISHQPLKGYEIHMGESKGDIDLFRLTRFPGSPIHLSTHSPVFDGSMNKNCWGTYIHGIFENDLFRRAVLNNARGEKGLPAIDAGTRYSEIKDKAIDTFSAIVRDNIDMDFIKKALKL